jgi:hypothetical protein
MEFRRCLQVAHDYWTRLIQRLVPGDEGRWTSDFGSRGRRHRIRVKDNYQVTQEEDHQGHLSIETISVVSIVQVELYSVIGPLGSI